MNSPGNTTRSQNYSHSTTATSRVLLFLHCFHFSLAHNYSPIFIKALVVSPPALDPDPQSTTLHNPHSQSLSAVIKRFTNCILRSTTEQSWIRILYLCGTIPLLTQSQNPSFPSTCDAVRCWSAHPFTIPRYSYAARSLLPSHEPSSNPTAAHNIKMLMPFVFLRI